MLSDGRSSGVAEARRREKEEKDGLVLERVLVCPLNTVEMQSSLLIGTGLWSSIHVWISDFEAEASPDDLDEGRVRDSAEGHVKRIKDDHLP